MTALDPVEAHAEGRKQGIEASIALLKQNLDYCSPFDGSASVLRGMIHKLEALRDGFDPETAQRATASTKLPIEGDRWQHKKTTRIATVVSVAGNSILYRYAVAAPNARSVQTVSMKVGDFLHHFERTPDVKAKSRRP